ncbi:hypothetical protein [Acinetobacter phage Ab69]|nr:hypothetical protein [Acinetobacter phage Ab69]
MDHQKERKSKGIKVRAVTDLLRGPQAIVYHAGMVVFNWLRDK